MSFKLEITINGSHPTETIATLGDLVYFIDDMASMFSSTQFVGEDDIPLIITYQGEHCLDPITSLPLPSQLVLSESFANVDLICPKLPEFKVGDKVRHVYTGKKFIIKASAYYHINRTFSYLVYNPNNDIFQLYAPEQLMTEELFSQIPTMLLNATDKVWVWNQIQGIFQCESNPTRKMRPYDAISNWQMYFEKQEVPF